MKKTSMIFLALLTLAAAMKPMSLSAGPAAEKGGAQGGQNITLRFAWWGADARHKATLAAMDRYHELHPNITLEGEYSAIDTYYSRLVTQFAGGTAPDIIQIDYPWITDFASQGTFFENLNDYRDILKLDKFDPAYLKGWCYNGPDRLEGLPFVLNGYTMMYNKNVVTLGGIDLNDTSLWSWDKLVEEGVKFKAKYPDYVYLHTDPQTLEKNIFKPYLIQTYGGQYINSDYTIPFTRANVVQAYRFLLELLDKGLIQPQSETAAYDGKIDQNPAWANGKAAICIRWVTDLIQLLNPNVDMGVARLPVIQGAKDTAINCKPGMLATIYSGSKYKREAAEFINWMLTDSAAVGVLRDTRGVPANPEARKQLSDAGILNAQMVKGTETASANAGTAQNGLNDNSEITSISTDVIAKVLYRRVTPEQGADEFLQRVGDKLKSMKP
jgi:oligogalacturonide transport system substrate-binding protein